MWVYQKMEIKSHEKNISMKNTTYIFQKGCFYLGDFFLMAYNNKHLLLLPWFSYSDLKRIRYFTITTNQKISYLLLFTIFTTTSMFNRAYSLSLNLFILFVIQCFHVVFAYLLLHGKRLVYPSRQNRQKVVWRSAFLLI